jgi:hypothetical protein
MDLSSNSNSNSGRRGLSVMDLFTQANLNINNITDCNNTECPISLEPIEPSGPLTPGLSIEDVLIDPKVKFIKVPENSGGFTCYSKSDFINYIKNKITDNIIDDKDNYFEIQSPATTLPIPIEIIQMLNSVFNIDFFVAGFKDVSERNKYAFDQMMIPTFYYSYDNPNNFEYSDNIFFLNYIYQYITNNIGRLDSHDTEIQYARKMITLQLTSYIDQLMSQGMNNNTELKKFQEVQNHFLPVVTFKTNANGSMGYDLHLDNHPYLMPQFRSIFMNPFISQVVNTIDRVAGVKTRSGTQLYGSPIAVHASSKAYKKLSQDSKNLYILLDEAKRQFYRRGVTLTPSSSFNAAGNAATAPATATATATATMDVDIAPGNGNNTGYDSNTSNTSNQFTVRRGIGRRGGSKKKRRKTLKKKKKKKRKTLKKN